MRNSQNQVSFCTIVTLNYMPFAKTLFQSINRFDKKAKFVVLIVDERKGRSIHNDFDCISLDELSFFPQVNVLKKKYSPSSDELRWSLKPYLMRYLLEYKKTEMVFYVDSDIYFYSCFKFLYDTLNNCPILLSPHWGCMDPKKSESYFSRLLTDGVYNAGFIGATMKGIHALNWWGEMCLYSCEKSKLKGFYDDQKYLDIIPIYCPDSRIIEHRGCNVGEWNRFECERIMDGGKLLINNEFPIIFIHFSNIGYLVEYDKVLIPFLKEYSQKLMENGLSFNFYQSGVNYLKRKKLRSLNLFQRIYRKIIGERKFNELQKWDI
ncbi:hypothetical protein IFO69_16930 [Echinicola sp. CAU 1574]|uniref:Nucleotide-diphospho-sugar transferase domain-containing protein n=1 Tax=Echinicola arenosa TaxID=2774144 RepID=A0ABR9ANS6_9BACT|nr:hypothetical protein [Echinicola arenosa]MBD8490438.1 hypothetical protein [Echinicola arenosa]